MRHRYVHGGFTGTDLRFAMYFPPKEQYQGRFFQYVLDVSGNENIVEHPESPNPSYTVNFAVDSGGYLVESNLGSLTFLPVSDPNIALFKASAAVAEESRIIANKMYCPHRPHGYIWGGSGGAYKVIAAVENTTGIWGRRGSVCHPDAVVLAQQLHGAGARAASAQGQAPRHRR